VSPRVRAQQPLDSSDVERGFICTEAQGSVVSDHDDWDFAGAEDAKADIRAAVKYLLSGAAGQLAVKLCGKSSRSFATYRTDYRLDSHIPWTMICRAADLPNAPCCQGLYFLSNLRGCCEDTNTPGGFQISR
jgi:hypothetical protein